MQTKTYSRFLFWTLASLVFILQGCGSAEESGSSLSCTTSASVSSGDVNSASVSVQLNNLNVYIYNGTSGATFTLTLPDGVSGSTTSTSYTYPNSFYLTTGSSGGISSSVSVTDGSSGSTASCTLSILGTTSSTVVSLAASPSTSVVKGSSITVTASASSVSSPVFSFSQSSSYPSYVNIYNSSNGVAVISSSIAQTVTVTAAMTSNSSGAASSSQTITLTFTESSSSTNVTLTASPSASVAVGNTISIYASVSGISDPVYSFSYVGGNSIGASGSQSGSTATIYSSNAGTLTIGVNVYSASNTSIQASNQIVITFTSSGSGSLTCTFSHVPGTYYRGSYVPFYITSNTNEQLKLNYWDPGEAWDNGGPSFPIYLPMSGIYSYFYGAYSYTGSKTVRILVESATRPGVFCNGGSYLTDTVYIY